MSQALADNLVQFGRLLRRSGLPVIPEQTRLFAATLEQIGVASRHDVKAAGRVIYTRRREEIAVYDAAFDLFWRRSAVEGGATEQLPTLSSTLKSSERAERAERAEGLEPADRSEAGLRLFPGTREQLRTRDFADLTPAEVREAEAMVAALRPRLPMRPSRRHRPARRGRRPALRAMMRRSLSTGGEALDWRWRRRDIRPRPIVLICDISGSMERYSRFLLRFGHALSRTGAPVEVFVFGTRLTRITRELRRRNADRALRDIARKVVDWSGGTRIGACLHHFNRHWVRRVMRSGALVLLVSDGWERDDPDRLGREVAALRRACHRLIWLDPLAGQPGFEPLTRGLLAVLPHVDGFVACGDVSSLEQLSQRLVIDD